ncbi:alpha/beta hydrolase [Leptolyngbya sp. GB1-A1]|uniref:alpha/beta hydrolase n=1 Tax=Leptolyngbya sp. GB1-A1 TaxID=2933908 RepID=UPI0032974FB8
MKTFRKKLSLWRLGLGLFVGSLPTFAVRPVFGAEHISLSYGVFQQSISIGALESYAATGKPNGAFMAFAHFSKPDQLMQLRQILTARVPLDSDKFRQFLHTAIGEQFVRDLAGLIQSNEPQLSISTLRSALIRASTEPGGLTLLNVLRQFPGDSVEIDLARSLKLIAAWQTLMNQTSQAIAQVDQKAKLEAATNPLPSPLPSLDLQYQGSFTWEHQTLTLTDRTRNRTIPVDLYLPLAQTPRPIIVISHGYGTDRNSLAYLAQHLASYGFVTAIPEHRGSNWQQIRAWLTGETEALTPAREFIDRPLDVSYVLDELERLSQPKQRLQGRLNLQQVGVIGQSFGGYTTLALAGATPRFEQHGTYCLDWQDSFNLSLMLQCEAQTLPQLITDRADPTDLADSRVKAAIAISPVGSQIFGQASLSQIKIPVLMIAGSADRIAPVLSEQIKPFTWLTTSHKYLALIHEGTHFSSIAPAANSEVVPLWGSDPASARRYVSALSTAFLQTYVADQPHYRPYLSAAYAATIGQDPLSVSLVRSLSAASFTPVSHRFPLTGSLIILGAGTQALGFVYFLKTRNRSVS